MSIEGSILLLLTQYNVKQGLSVQLGFTATF